MHEEGRTWEVTSLFRKLKVPRFPPCPLMRRGWLCLLATLDAKRRSPPCCRHAGLLCVPPWETRGEMGKIPHQTRGRT